jgi:hypothetical protein
VGKSLRDHAAEPAPDFVKRVPKPRTTKGVPKNTRVSQVRGRGHGRTYTKRKPPVVPEGKSAAEIEQMDPEDSRLRHPGGRPRRSDYDPDDWRDAIKQAIVLKKRQARAEGRKAEAATVAKIRENPDVVIAARKNAHRSKGATIEDAMVVEGIVDLDDWDDEELAMGFRRNRNGKFGNPPAYIPRQVMQEAWRRLVSRGDMKMRASFITVLENLIDLATTSDSDKVQLEASKHLLERLVGKVPDKLLTVNTEAPWEAFLFDAVVPFGQEQAQLPAGSEIRVGPVGSDSDLDPGAALGLEADPSENGSGPTSSKAREKAAAKQGVVGVPKRRKPKDTSTMPLVEDDYF